MSFACPVRVRRRHLLSSTPCTREVNDLGLGSLPQGLPRSRHFRKHFGVLFQLFEKAPCRFVHDSTSDIDIRGETLP